MFNINYCITKTILNALNSVWVRRKENYYHARVIPKGVIHLDDLAERIHDQSSFTIGDIYGVVDALIRTLSDYLKLGYWVSIQGLGEFRLSIQSNKPIIDPEKVLNTQIKVKQVLFRPEVNFKDDFKIVNFKRVYSNSRSPYTKQERWQRLEAYLKENNQISASDYKKLNQMHSSTCYHDLTDWRNQNLLNVVRFDNSLHYKLNEIA